MYRLRVSFNDQSVDQVLELPDLDRDRAEAFAGELRYEVEQARDVDSPIVQVAAPDGGELTWDPHRIIGIDLEDTAER